MQKDLSEKDLREIPIMLYKDGVFSKYRSRKLCMLSNDISMSTMGTMLLDREGINRKSVYAERIEDGDVLGEALFKEYVLHQPKRTCGHSMAGLRSFKDGVKYALEKASFVCDETSYDMIVRNIINEHEGDD